MTVRTEYAIDWGDELAPGFASADAALSWISETAVLWQGSPSQMTRLRRVRVLRRKVLVEEGPWKAVVT